MATRLPSAWLWNHWRSIKVAHPLLDWFWYFQRRVKTALFCVRCLKQSGDILLPYAVKHSVAGQDDTTVRKEAAMLATLRGLPGVLQGEGTIYEQEERVCTLSE